MTKRPSKRTRAEVAKIIRFLALATIDELRASTFNHHGGAHVAQANAKSNRDMKCGAGSEPTERAGPVSI